MHVAMRFRITFIVNCNIRKDLYRCMRQSCCTLLCKISSVKNAYFQELGGSKYE